MRDFSRDPEVVLQDALAKNYSRVRFQQGKALLDRELNLLAEFAGPQRFAQNNFGNGVRGEGSDFLITNLSVPTNDFRITAGTCLVNGYEVVLLATPTYKTQPKAENVAPLPAAISKVYLRVYRSEATGFQDVGLGAVTEPTLAKDAVSNRTFAKASVSIAKLSATQVVSQQDGYGRTCQPAIRTNCSAPGNRRSGILSRQRSLRRNPTRRVASRSQILRLEVPNNFAKIALDRGIPALPSSHH